MIKTIIKRDGTEEDFSPSKINKWGEWASKTLGKYVDWSHIVLHAVSTCPEVTTSKVLQQRLIKACLDEDTWSYNRMAGRLYAAYINKELYNDKVPTVKELHRKLQNLNIMKYMSYSDDEYSAIEKMIDHKRDLKSTHFELEQIRKKYALRNRVTGEEYESQQFVYMRMAMAVAEDEPKEERLEHVKYLYDFLSLKKLNAPTPNYLYLGTNHKGLASCCIYKAGDTAASLAIGDHIAYTMTYMSAGIGSYIETRSVGDPVHGGVIEHQGKLPYYRSLDGAVHANLQAGRGGACTTYFSAFDPEVKDITLLKNPMSTKDKQIRGLDYAMIQTKFFAKKVAKNEDIFVFNVFTAPDLVDALFDGDETKFVELYSKYEADESFEKKWVNARSILINQRNEAHETGKGYLFWSDEVNRHTPHKDKIYSSNLCTETALPTLEYNSMEDLYSTEDKRVGEVATCNLAAIIVPNIESEEEYAKVAFYALMMIDKTIHMADYPLKHVGVTAKARMNAGVGIIGLAHYMAKKKLKYSSDEGKQEIDRLSERHAWHLINASLELSKKYGVAPWMNRTKWPDGWLPIDTYNKNVDTVVPFETHYDWEDLRSRIIENGGIRNSSLINHMPAESSSKSAATTNGLYPIREMTLLKTDQTNAINWAAPDGEKLEKYYEFAWDIDTKDMIDCYAIVQKWTDQAISADLYRKLVGADVVTTQEMIRDYLYMTKMGMKTQYYTNVYTANTNATNTDDNEYCDSCGV